MAAMAAEYAFAEEALAVDESLGYPKAYAKLCRDRSAALYGNGPPFTFTPYMLQPQEAVRASDFDEMFPVIDPKAKPTSKPKIFISLLWKQLNHLGNAGFDPATIRVDPNGNVLYYHADSASPLAWSIDHWFPSSSRGGLTVPSNLRILQWQVCKKKHIKLEFLIPWWDLQLGISVNQFLSIFASSNSDFRHRGFSFLFSEGENEELNDAQTVESHNFPQHFVESKEKLGLAPAAIVSLRRETYETSSALKSLDINRRQRPSPCIVASSRIRSSLSKENEAPDMVSNPYHAIVMARDSLKQREETLKMQAEIQKLDNEVNELSQKNEEDRITIQDLEMALIKRRRRAEKCRRLAEAQNSYRTMLEKMIRDAMHQSVIYKEQVRLNQAATNALKARLEAQRAICDASEKELHKRFKIKDETEKQIRPQLWEQTRKRSRMDDNAIEDEADRPLLYLPGIEPTLPSQKELRVFLEEEHKASKANLFLHEAKKQEETELNKKDPVLQAPGEGPEDHGASKANPFLHEAKKQEETELNKKDPVLQAPGGGLEDHSNSIIAVDDNIPIEDQLQTLEISTEKTCNMPFPLLYESKIEEDEESRQKRGKGNVEKWLRMLLENAQESFDVDPQKSPAINKTDESNRNLKMQYPQKDGLLRAQRSENKGDAEQVHEESKQLAKSENCAMKEKEEADDTEATKPTNKLHDAIGKGVHRRYSFEGKEKRETCGKERKLVRSESARTFRRIPSSPSIILGMKKGADCIGKKPAVTDEDDYNEKGLGSSYIKTSIKSFRKAVRI